MEISEKGLELIKKFEGCRLQAYQDSVGVWTIGYGTTNADKAITGTTIYQGLRISQATAVTQIYRYQVRSQGGQVQPVRLESERIRWTCKFCLQHR